MIWEVFRQRSPKAEFVYCRDVHAPDREMAKQFAVIQHGRRKPTNALWVAPQDEIESVVPDEDTNDVNTEGDSVEWRVFRPDSRGYHTHVGDIEAPNAAVARRDAVDAFAEDERPLWVVEADRIGEITADEVAFGGTTDKSYRFAQTYNVDPAAEEVEASENEQIEAEKRRRGGA